MDLPAVPRLCSCELHHATLQEAAQGAGGTGCQLALGSHCPHRGLQPAEGDVPSPPDQEVHEAPHTREQGTGKGRREGGGRTEDCFFFARGGFLSLLLYQ